MSAGASEGNTQEKSRLARQLEGLADALMVGPGLLTEAQMESGEHLGRQAEDRFHLSPEHTTVGFFGATGSGKSSLFNRVVGSEVAHAGVKRPTTFKVTAALWQEGGAGDLLDWLQVDEVFVAGEKPALVLLDLPDFDSVAKQNRAVADRLVGQVDVLVWVVDPQKYGDRVIHQDYIRPLAHHASTTIVVLNQVDLLDEGERDQILTSLRGLLAADGLPEVHVLAASAATGEGIDALRDEILAIAKRQHAAAHRLGADVEKWAEDVLRSVAGGDEAAVSGESPSRTAGTQVARRRAAGVQAAAGIAPIPSPNPKSVKQLNQAVQAAAGVGVVGDAVASSYKKRAHQATGWPVVSWVGRFRSDPLRRLGIEKAAETGARTSLPPLTGVGKASLNTAIRNFGEEVAGGVPPGWKQEVVRAATRSSDSLAGNLDRAVGRADHKMSRPWWWAVGSAFQWLMLTVALVGAGWYLAAWVTAAFGLPLIPISKVEGWPVPGLLILFGLLAGLLLAVLFGGFGSVGAARRKRASTASLRAQVDAVTQEQVVEPVLEVTERMNRLREALLRAEGR